MFRESSGLVPKYKGDGSKGKETRPLVEELWMLKKNFATDQKIGLEEKRAMAQGLYDDLTNRYVKFKSANQNLSEPQRIEGFINDQEASRRLREVVEKGLANFITSQEADEKAPKVNYAPVLKADITEINRLATAWLGYHRKEYK